MRKWCVACDKRLTGSYCDLAMPVLDGQQIRLEPLRDIGACRENIHKVKGLPECLAHPAGIA